MADIEELLTEAGERWRAGQPVPPQIEPPMERRLVARPSTGWLIAAAALIGALALAGPLTTGAPHEATSHIGVEWNRTSLLAAVIHPGDRVTATAVVIAQPSVKPQVCVGGGTRFTGAGAPQCSAIAVSLDGVNLENLPGRVVVNGVVESGYVTVRGVWTGTSIAVESIDLVPGPNPGLSDLPGTPCPEPPAGWLFPVAAGSFRAALRPLVNEIITHPDLYGRYWTIPPLNPTNDAGPAVEMIVAKVDPETLRLRVESLFPYGACLLHGEFTSEQLSLAGSTLAREHPTWMVGSAGDDSTRIPVQLAMLDDAAASTLAEHPETYPVPLVVKAPSSPAEPTDSVQPPSTFSATPRASLGLVNGLPVSIDSQPVLAGDAATTALRNSTDSLPMLIGGWLHAPQVYSCPNVRSPSPWNPCAATRLFPSPFAGPDAMGIFRDLSGPGLPTIPDGSVQAVVLRVHSHDAACTTGAECIGLPVLDAVVWSSPVQPIVAPTSTRPPTGMSERTAIEAAIRVASGQTSSGITVIAAQSGPYAIVGPGDSGFPGDSWAWAITVGANFDPPDCYTGASAVCSPTRSSELVVFDYFTGAFVIADSPAPKPGPTTNDAGKGAINLVSKLEIDRAAANWDDAWGLLGPLSQARIGLEAQFVALETTYNEAGGGFRIDQVIGGPFGPAVVDNYFGLSVFLDDLVRAGGDPNQAQLVIVTHPDAAGVGGSGTYLVAHVAAGWRIWIVN